ncbi:hypothetical protein [Actinosynnema sp. NPDC020468]|uniref:hypothetical protein n=1 Tax=Actinosynnema sp. NPDC020468 TaxID=3154488 RepID=UPI0033D42A09
MTYPQEPDGPQQQPYLPPPPPLSDAEVAGSTPLQAPKEVRTSFWLWIVGAAVSVISALLTLTQRDEVEQQLRDTPQGKQLSADQLAAAVNAGLLVAVLVALVFAGLYVLFAFKAKAGRNWARIVLTVLTLLGLLALLRTASVLGVFTNLISVIAIVLLYLPASKAYFDSVKRRP